MLGKHLFRLYFQITHFTVTFIVWANFCVNDWRVKSSSKTTEYSELERGQRH